MKLVYLAHGWMLAVYNAPLVREDFEAWRYGPVVPDLYHTMKIYRADPLLEPLAFGSIGKVRNGRVVFVPIEPRPFTQQESRIIHAVYEHFGSWPASRLVQITHEVGTPWHRVWAQGSQGRKLSNRWIGKFFRDQRERARG